jgi:hypothetical protein
MANLIKRRNQRPRGVIMFKDMTYNNLVYKQWWIAAKVRIRSCNCTFQQS